MFLNLRSLSFGSLGGGVGGGEAFMAGDEMRLPRQDDDEGVNNFRRDLMTGRKKCEAGLRLYIYGRATKMEITGVSKDVVARALLESGM